ncbi:MAG: cell division protein SepF [Allobaculum sp.]
MGFMDKLKAFVEPDDEEYEGEMEEIEQPVNTNTTTAEAPYRAPVNTYETRRKNGPTPLDDKTKMVLFEPRSFGEAEVVGSRLKEGRAVVVNLHKLDREFARRTVDFLSGVVYALDGNVQKIGQNVILCYPSDIGVAGSINLGTPADDQEVEVEEEIAE